MTAAIGDSAPHLAAFTIVLLLLVYGYEIFNFSLSIDEELSGFLDEADRWRSAVMQGRWGLGLLAWAFPPLGSIPMVSTVLFCAGLGASAFVLGRVFFRNHAAQYAFVGLYVSAPLWPHVAEFNTISWSFGIACCLITLALLFFQSGVRFGDLWAGFFLAIAAGIYQTFYLWFFVLLFIRHLSVVLGTAPIEARDLEEKAFPWMRIVTIALVGLVGYLALGRLVLAALSLKLTYVQDFLRLDDFRAAPAAAFARILKRSWNGLTGADPIYLGYGRLLTLLPLIGLLVVLGRVLFKPSLGRSQRVLTVVILVVTLALVVSPIVLSAGHIPDRAVLAWIPVSAFFGGVAFASSGRFDKALFVLLGATLLVSMWVSVSLFYTDHLARERDEFLAGRIMDRVDSILPKPPPTRIPFFVVGAVPEGAAGPFRKLEVFGDSFFDSSHEGGNPYRVAGYLSLLGVDFLEPRVLEDANPLRSTIEAMPVWPAAESVAMVKDALVIKLGPLPAEVIR